MPPSARCPGISCLSRRGSPLHIADLEDALTFATYFIIALAVGSLTAQLKAREHLAAQVQLAKNSERLRKTLLDCVSHELKTPLAAIGAASQELLHLASNSQDAEMLKQLAGEIHAGSHRLHRVVNNLLDMNRLESGVIHRITNGATFASCLQSAVEIERESIDGREIRLDVPENIPLPLWTIHCSNRRSRSCWPTRPVTLSRICQSNSTLNTRTSS